jgi:hypothetical protein
MINIKILSNFEKECCIFNNWKGHLKKITSTIVLSMQNTFKISLIYIKFWALKLSKEWNLKRKKMTIWFIMIIILSIVHTPCGSLQYVCTICLKFFSHCVYVYVTIERLISFFLRLCPFLWSCATWIFFYSFLVLDLLGSCQNFNPLKTLSLNFYLKIESLSLMSILLGYLPWMFLLLNNLIT